MIPKIIHYCWFGNKPLTPLAKKCIESWKKYCPDYEIRRWDETNFDVNVCAYVKQAYSVQKWAFVSDFARFYILYKEGGIYFDTDLELIHSIDDITKNGAFMACESKYSFKDDSFIINGSTNGIINRVNSGLGIAFQAEDPFLKEIIHCYDERNFYISDSFYDKTTVGDFLTNLLVHKGFDVHLGIIQKVDSITIYPKDYFSGKDNVSGDLVITDNTRAIHHGAASWMSKMDKRLLDGRKKYRGRGKLIYIFGFLLQFPRQLYSDICKHGFTIVIRAYILRLKYKKSIGVI